MGTKDDEGKHRSTNAFVFDQDTAATVYRKSLKPDSNNSLVRPPLIKDKDGENDGVVCLNLALSALDLKNDLALNNIDTQFAKNLAPKTMDVLAMDKEQNLLANQKGSPLRMPDPQMQH